MADQQKIHPVHDPEAAVTHQTPTAPLVPRGSSRSDKGDPAAAASEEYPPLRREYPVIHSKPPKRRSCCCKFFCWTLSVILILIVAIAITIGILFLVFRPKLPKYSIDSLQVTQFSLSNNDSLSASFNVTITARNPNKKIGIYYRGGSHISAFYNGTKLCQGALPKFYQGHKNTTVLVIPLTGQTDNATGLISSVQTTLSQTGIVPLKVRVRQPVRVKLGKLKLPRVKFSVRCSLDVDSLSTQNSVRIKRSSCSFRLRL